MMRARRYKARYLAIISALVFAAYNVSAQEGLPQHGLSIFGDLKYKPDFTHFDYVNPDAPKGGALSHVGAQAAYNASFLSFDTLNGYILKGNAAQGLQLVFDTLMTRAYDEPDAVYGLVAESVSVAPDKNRAVFTLRKAARFHDGTPLTAHDVAFSLELLKKDGHPLIAQPLREMEEARALNDTQLAVRFTGKQTRDLLLFVAQLPIFSKRYYTQHDFTRADMTPPLGSGPYKISKADVGRAITYERERNYWARDLPVNRGRWNFDTIRFEYFRDRTSQFEAFKARDYILREEFTSKTWATQYDFPAVEDGRVLRLTIPDDNPSGAQGWFINMRRDKFKDVRVREALGFAFNFEWANRSQFYGLYDRTQSFFENTPMKASGVPAPDEIKLLEPHRDALPKSVFGEALLPPVSDLSGADRRNLRRAAKLLRAAGWRVKDKKRRNAKGEILSIEFLTDEPTFERIIGPYVRNLERLGIDAEIRLVDSAQYQSRLRNYDYDFVTRRFTIPNTPGVELRSYFDASFAEVAGGFNMSGLADPVIDALVDEVVAAPTRKAQITAARALDRVLRAHHIWVPQWFKASHHLAFWDVFARPKTKPLYARGVLDTWWRKN